MTEQPKEDQGKRGMNVRWATVPSPFLTREELAQRWRCGKTFVQTLRGIPYLKAGRTILYRLEDVEAYEHNQRRGVEGVPLETDTTETAPETPSEIESLRASLDGMSGILLGYDEAIGRISRQLAAIEATLVQLKSVLPPPALSNVRDNGIPQETGSHPVLQAADDPEREAMVGTLLRFMERTGPGALDGGR